MARPIRLDFPGAKHHVMNRGHRRRPIFVDDWCCEAFLCFLAETVERYEIILHAYALMPNHYHLLVESVDGNLSRAMAFLSSGFSARLNRRNNWEGSVFRGRFHNRVVSAQDHWQYLLAYIHLNPVKAKLVTKLGQTRWTSHASYTGRRGCPDWLHTEAFLEALGGREEYRKYIRSVQLGRRPAPADFETVLFKRRRSSEFFLVKQDEQVRELSAEEAIEQVLKITSASRRELKQSKRGREGNPARAVAAWWLTHGAGLTNVKAAAYLNMTPVAVSRVITKVKSQLVRNSEGEIYRWVQLLKDI
jgi:REP element-mobilizing transposase RayT